MRDRNERSLDILLYLDSALTGQKLEDFRAHLAVCSDCRERLEEERALSRLLRETRPLYLAPQALRVRIAAATTEKTTTVSRSSVSNRKTRMHNLRRWLLDLGQSALRWKPLTALTLVFLLGLVFIPDVVQQVRATDYVEAATQIHRSH
jgi:hypothetical protein